MFFELDFFHSFYRLYHSSLGDRKKLLNAARSERHLLKTYDIESPKCESPNDLEVSSDSICRVTVSILKRLHPIVLDDFLPMSVFGDGNCMYRAVSLAYLGTQQHHRHLRLLTALEIIENRAYYDTDYRKYIDLINDKRVLCSSYETLVKETCQDGSYAEILQMYAISAVLMIGIKSYYPPTPDNELLSVPFTRRVYGRGVSESAGIAAVLMWTQCTPLHKGVKFRANHFVILKQKSEPVSITINSDIDIEESLTESESLPSFESADESISLLSEDMPSEESLDLEESPVIASTPSDTTHQPDSEENKVKGGSISNGKFLGIETVVTLLASSTIDDVKEKIPNGVKENVYFVVNNEENVQKRASKVKSEFFDDCGIWETSSGCSPKSGNILGITLALPSMGMQNTQTEIITEVQETF